MGYNWQKDKYMETSILTREEAALTPMARAGQRANRKSKENAFVKYLARKTFNGWRHCGSIV